MRHLFLCLLLVALSPLVLFGQRTAATLSGTVTDPSGAVVPNAKVTATSTSTGAATSAIANASGFYVIPNLQPGPYKLDVAAAGFQSYEQTGIVLQTGMEMGVNVSLKLGSSIEKVTVTGQSPLVNTRDQTLSTAITPQFTEQLPLNGRNILLLMTLAPDSSQSAGSSQTQLANRPEAKEALTTASGESRGDSTTYYLNGGLNMDTYTLMANVFPNPDAVQEFTYDTNSYSAKYGGLGGGVVSAITRGGTNQVHGSAFEYLRNGAANARNFFSATHDNMNRNQFGFSLGAPIQKDKTFAFFSFQRTTFRYGSNSGAAFGPTFAELGKNPDGSPLHCTDNPTEVCGDWSAAVGATQLYNNVLTRGSDGLPITFTTDDNQAHPVHGVPFAHNQIPLSLYNPVALKVLALVPQGDPITGKITYTSRTLNNDNQYVARVDRNFGEKLRIGVSILRDTYMSPALVDPKNALTSAFTANWPSLHAAVNGTYIFGPNLVTTVGAAYSRALIRMHGPSDFPSVNSLGANFPDWAPAKEYIGGAFGWYGWTAGGYYNISRNQYDFTNNWTYTKGNHTLDFGGEYVISQSIMDLPAYWGGGYTGSWCGYSGYSPVDFLMGQNCYYQQFGVFYDAARGKVPAAYVSDKWKITRRLTLNLGVRWEPWTFWPDRSAAAVGQIFNQAAFEAGTRSTRFPNLPPGYLVRGDAGVPNSLISPDWKLFNPRIGLAWDVRGNGKTSVRAGFGLYHDQPMGNWYNAEMSFPFLPSYIITDPTVPWFSPYNATPYNGTLPALQVPPPPTTVYPQPLSGVMGFSPDFKPQGTAQWNLTIEQQLGKGILLRASYSASQSWHIPDTRDINSAIYIPGNNTDGTPKSTGDNVAQRRPLNPYYGSIALAESAETASYNALAISVEKRMTGNLSLLGGYRWAKCLDEGALISTGSQEFSDSRNRMLDRGLCNSDIASQIKMAVVYKTPSLRSRGFAVRNILGGWTMSGIWQWRDGFPFSVQGNVDSNLDGYGGDRAALVGNPVLSGSRSTAAKLNEWFNTAAFVNSPVGVGPGSARNRLRGPGYFNLDYSLIKSFPIPYGPLKETQKLDFRAEFFNIFNHPSFGAPYTGLGSAQFGQIWSAGSPRILQFALKYIF